MVWGDIKLLWRLLLEYHLLLNIKIVISDLVDIANNLNYRDFVNLGRKLVEKTTSAQHLNNYLNIS